MYFIFGVTFENQQARQREDEFKEQIKSMTARLKQVQIPEEILAIFFAEIPFGKPPFLWFCDFI